MSESKGKSMWLWLGLGAAAVGVFFLSKKSQAAAGLDPLSPPPTSDPKQTREQLALAWSKWIAAVAAHYGYVLQPSYNGTTYQLVDKDTGDGGRLINRNQAITDAHLQFWWLFNDVFNTHTQDLNADTTWTRFQSLYDQLKAGFTPAFFAK